MKPLIVFYFFDQVRILSVPPQSQRDVNTAVQRIRRVMLTSRSDSIVMLLTLLTTVLVRNEYGILVGIIAAAVIQLGRSRALRLNELVPDGDSFEEIPYFLEHFLSPKVLAFSFSKNS